MHLPIELASLLLAAVLPIASAQTFTECDPLKKTCPADQAQSSSEFTTDFKSASSLPAGWHRVPCAGNVDYGKNGQTSLIINKAGDCPTIETDNYVFFGYFEVTVKAAPGTGIVSSVVMQSDVRDEIDWEFIGGENYRVQSNYFGKADTSTFDRMQYIPIADNQNTFATYGVNWTSAAITFFVNGAAVRTINYNDAKGGTRFPQTPMRLRIGNWAAGSPGNEKGTVDWAGGLTDFGKAPFPMSIQSAKVINYSPAKQYRYKDNSGSWQSIEVIGGNTGGIVSPSQNSAAQSSISSSTEGVSSVKTMVPVQSFTASASGSGSASSAAATSGISVAPASSGASGVKNGTAGTPTKPSLSSATASKSGEKPASQSTNAAISLSGMGQAAGISVLSALLFAFLG